MTNYPWYAEQLGFLLAITEHLNTMPTQEGYYLHVELRHADHDENNVVGIWSDEIGPGDWAFTEATHADH